MAGLQGQPRCPDVMRPTSQQGRLAVAGPGDDGQQAGTADQVEPGAQPRSLDKGRLGPLPASSSSR